MFQSFVPRRRSSQRESDRSQNASFGSHTSRDLSLAAVKSEGIGQESKRYFGITPVGICQGARKHLRVSSLAAVKSEGIGQESKRYFGSLIPRRSHTSRDLSRSQETFETVSTLIIASSAGSGQEHETHLWQICSFVPRRSQVRGNRTGVKTLFGILSLAAVTPVGICQGARKHLRQSHPSS
ncbi:hypothetical protein M5D96_012577 [Drosophila gunungcola]|uniref:Uncharacterized protein n=1 Tax=Drosophila gunungcola TaxID=103775 RepID=A0A9P9YDQ1_9MUSC|nr:hypothetical protein M5D96_012577 [Drosophila gunungcola]